MFIISYLGPYAVESATVLQKDPWILTPIHCKIVHA